MILPPPQPEGVGWRHDATAVQTGLTLSQALNSVVRELLAERGWSHSTLAEQLDVTSSAVTQRLRREATEVDFYERLAKAFELPVSELFKRAEVRRAGSQAGRGKRPKRLPGSWAQTTYTAHLREVDAEKALEAALREIEGRLADLQLALSTLRNRRQQQQR